MPKSNANLALKGLDEMFSTEESRQEQKREQVQQIPIEELFPFKEHPFKVLDDEAMQRTVESVAQYSVLAPLIARPRPEGGYEIISGHRRQYAAKLAGLDTLPVIVRQMSDDAAVILMVDSNLQREHILPSERALAYKMKLDAMRRTSGRPSKENVSQIGTQKRSDQIMAEELGESRNQIQRFIRLTNLIPELLDLVDEKKISFNPAVELSYLDEAQQRDFFAGHEAIPAERPRLLSSHAAVSEIQLCSAHGLSWPQPVCQRCYPAESGWENLGALCGQHRLQGTAGISG